MSDMTTPWYTCPTCGNKRIFPQAGGVRGTRHAVAFLDGAKGWWAQHYRVQLRCPCGHRWELLQVVERGQPTRYEPAPDPPPPPTPEQQHSLELGAQVRDRRVACHTSLRAAAEIIGVTAAELSAIERGEAEPDADIMSRLEAFYAARGAIPIERRDVLM